MAMDRPNTHPRKFYVAVSQHESKLTTLLELVAAIHRDRCLLSDSLSNGQGMRGASSLPGASHDRDHVGAIPRQLAIVICCSSRDSLDSVARALVDSAPELNISVLHSDMTERERERQLTRIRGFTTSSRGLEATPSSDGKGLPASRATTTQGLTSVDAAGQCGTGPLPPGQDLDAVRQATAASRREPDGSSGVTRYGQGLGLNGPWCGEPGGPTALVLITTDPPLKAAPKELLPLGVTLLIQYDLARQKEVYMKRMTAAFGGGKERRLVAGRAVIDFVVAGEVDAFRSSESWSPGVVQEMPVHVADVF